MQNLSKAIWGAGFAAVAIGEIMAAEDKKPSDTISEWFRDQPRIVQFAIIFFCGAVFSHFAEWRIRDPDPTIQAETIEKVEINES